MKIKKLLSIGALTLALVSFTSIGASAAEVVNGTEGNRKPQMQNLIQNGLDGKKVVSKLSITANTEFGDYLTDDAIIEINQQLSNAGIAVKISKDDNYYTAQKAIVKAAKNLDNTSKENAFTKLKTLANNKLTEAQGYSDTELAAEAKKYFKVSNYGKLVFGTNMDNSRVVSLIDGSGNVIAQISGENIKTAKEKVSGVNSLEELIGLANKYYPGAEDYITSIK